MGGWDDDFFVQKEHEFNGNGKAIDVVLKNGAYTGVGNYLALEALGKMKIHPLDKWDSDRSGEFIETIHKIARLSFKHGGNSFAGGYVRLDGSHGDYAKHCQFYRNPERKKDNYKGRPIYY